MSERDVAPALTAEEWEDVLEFKEAGYGAEFFGTFLVRENSVAAACLHGTFTWEHVDLLRRACVVEFFDSGGVDEDHADREALDELAALIESLLPPRVHWFDAPEGIRARCSECQEPPVLVAAIRTRYSGDECYRDGFQCENGHEWWFPPREGS